MAWHVSAKRLLPGILGLLWVNVAHGSEPLALTNLNPVIQAYSLPAATSARVVAEQDLTVRVSISMANSSITDSIGNETITLDGESYRTTLAFNYGWRPDLDFGVELPIIQHSGGFLDRPIAEWHDLFGLTNSRRDNFPKDRFYYNYQRSGVTVIDMVNETGGIGDLSLNVNYQLHNGSNGGAALKLGGTLKLPTGDVDKLTGSGSTDVSLMVHGALDDWIRKWQLSLYGGAGLTAITHSKLLDSQVQDLVPSGYLGVNWQVFKPLNLIAQLHYQGEIFESTLDQLGGQTVYLVTGGRIRLEETIHFDIAIVENLVTDPTPDFVVYLGLLVN
jgi:hypothetical protein